MKLQAAIITNAPPQLLASVLGPMDVLDGGIFVSRRIFSSPEHLKTLIGTIQGRAEILGHAFDGAIMIPAGVKPPQNKNLYQIKGPLKARLDYGSNPDWYPSLMELRSPYQQFYAAKQLEHPDTVVIAPNEWYPNGLSEDAIHKYYDKVSGSIVKQYKSNDWDGTIWIKADDKDELVVRRHAHREVLAMKMDDTNAFNTMNTGRTVEYHFAIGPNTKLTWIDLDPKEQFPWEDLKQLALDLTLELRKNPECKGVEVRFSGGDGFHIYCHLTSEVATATAREEMKAFLEGFINRRKDDRLTTDATKEPTKARLDYSTIRDKGGLRMAHSLAYPTGLACTPLKETDILKFDKEMAKVV